MKRDFLARGKARNTALAAGQAAANEAEEHALVSTRPINFERVFLALQSEQAFQCIVLGGRAGHENVEGVAAARLLVGQGQRTGSPCYEAGEKDQDQRTDLS